MLKSNDSQVSLPHKIYCGKSTPYYHILCDLSRERSQARQLSLTDWVSILAGGPLVAASIYGLLWAGWIIGLALGVEG
jgi:hypothetical protein